MFKKFAPRFLVAAALTAAAAQAAPLRHDHPLIGTWQITLADGSCSETYRIRDDGSSLVTSNEEVAESTFDIADQPDALGFYKQVDRVVKDNGKPDCSGEVTEVGHVATSYILFHPSGNMFLMCFERDMHSCIGPFIRVRGNFT
ncbi:MAG TPA: hypothetical protein VFT05_10015 [Burkholderiaceae bacterium]|nr:hypothetical protein [Burkholderiaceae bacterium]